METDLLISLKVERVDIIIAKCMQDDIYSTVDPDSYRERDTILLPCVP